MRDRNARGSRMTLLWTGLAALLFTGMLSPSATAAPPPASAFGRLPAMSEVVMSPNGKLLAWGEGDLDESLLVIFDLEQRKKLRRISLGEKLKLREVAWANDLTVLVTVSWARDFYATSNFTAEIFRTTAIDATGGPPREIRMSSQGSIVAIGAPNEKSVTMVAIDYNATRDMRNTDSRLRDKRADAPYTVNLYHVDVSTGFSKRVEAGNPFTYDYAIDRGGNAIARADYDPKAELSRLFRKQGGGWAEFFRLQGTQQLSLYGASEDGKFVYVLGAIAGSAQKFWRIPIDGSAPQIMAEHAEREVVGVILDRYSRLPVGALLGGSDVQARWFDEKSAKRHAALEKSFPGRVVTMYGRSASYERVLAQVQSMNSAPTYYVVDFAARKADIVGEHYPELASATLGEVTAITYKARDNYEIPAYLTTPPGAEKKGLPLVVLPHGGPEARDWDSFDWWAQFLATRGYAVLQPQFRGSTGFGEAHRKAGYRQWGKRMQDDVTDGVRALVAQGIVDSRRVCIVGASYGGYAALAGAAFTPELYRCAASINGVSDLPTMIGQVRIGLGKESNSLAYWKDHIGDATDPDVIAKSPARHASAVQAAVLLMHGDKDAIVDPLQSQMMLNALRAAGKDVRLVILENEDHWLSGTKTRTQMLTELEAFLGKHLGTRPAQ